MQTTKLAPPVNGDRSTFDEGRLSRSELLQQLDRIVESKHFRNSKRYPSFLRFVVEQTLAGKTEELKERTLGVDVFARRSDYDTNADPIVRVTAGEIRKRIAQYYQDPGHTHELRIDLPLGSYVPRFLRASLEGHSTDRNHARGHAGVVADTATTEQETEWDRPGFLIPAASKKSLRRRWLKWILLPSVVALAITALYAGKVLFRDHSRQKGMIYFWRPIIASGNPVLIVIGVHTLDSRGLDKPTEDHTSSEPNVQESMLSSMIRSDMVPVSDIVSYSRVTDQLTRKSRSYRTMGSSDTAFEALRQGPVILIGGLDNVWTMRLISSLRYSFYASSVMESEIRDNKNPSRAWKFDNMQLASGSTRDYAIVASYFDPTIEQHVLVVAGIGKSGTQAAAEFLTSNQDMEDWLKESGVTQEKNVELVLSTEILDGEPGPPHVVASSIW